MKLALLIGVSLSLLGCASTGGKHEQDASPSHVPVDPWQVPEPIPRSEPRSRYGNPSSYEVFGKRYHVMDSADGYVGRGIASWYGTKFHGRRTSSGEPYDMFALTAAHKTLPLPTYVRVKNLENGRSLIVKVNDRGPFHPGRIIDLSYTAAVRLGIYAKGSAQVEVTALTGADIPREPPKPEAPIDVVPQEPDPLGLFVAELESRPLSEPEPEALPFLELGAFRKIEDCVQLESALRERKLLAIQVSNSENGGCRVLQGPFATSDDADIQAQSLRNLGFNSSIIYP